MFGIKSQLATQSHQRDACYAKAVNPDADDHAENGLCSIAVVALLSSLSSPSKVGRNKGDGVEVCICYCVPEECCIPAHIMRVWLVAMVVDIPVGRETTHTVQEITEAEVENQQKYWIFSHGKLLPKLLLYSHWEKI